jgi:hypothetical protein
MKNVCFVYIFKHNIKAYLNLEIGIKICVINNTDKLKCIRKSCHTYVPKIVGALAS